jgi:hypothetical protein
MRIVAWIAVVVVLGVSSLADAQPRRGGGPGGAVQRREEIKRKIRTLRAYTLTMELALDEHTAGRLFPVLSRYDDEIDRMLEKRRDLQQRLQQVSDGRDPRAVDRLIDDAIANQRAFRDLEDKRIADLRKILTPAQTAKLLVVLPAFDRRIQNQLSRAIVRQRGAVVGDDDDDDVEPDEIAPPRKAPLRRREGPLPSRGSMSNAPPCDPSAGPCR